MRDGRKNIESIPQLQVLKGSSDKHSCEHNKTVWKGHYKRKIESENLMNKFEFCTIKYMQQQTSTNHVTNMQKQIYI